MGQYSSFSESCVCVATSTPDGTQELPDETEISIIPIQPQPSITLSDDELEESLRVLSAECHKQNVHEQSTLRLDTPDRSQSSRDQSRLTSHSPRDTYENQNPDQSRTTRNQTPDSQQENNNQKKLTSSAPEESRSPRKEIIKVSEQVKSIHNKLEDLLSAHTQSIRIQGENLISKDSPTLKQEESRSPRKQRKDPVSEKCKSPRKESIDPAPELMQIPKKPIKTDPESPRKENKQPLHENNQITTDTSILTTPKSNLSISEAEENYISEQCPCESTCEYNQMENLILDESKIPNNQSEKLKLKQNSIKHSKIPVPEHARNRNVNQLPEYSQTTSSASDTTPKFQPKYLRLEHFPKKRSCMSEIDEESSEIQTTNEESMPTEQSESDGKLIINEQNQSSTETSGIAKPTFLRLNLYHYPKKGSTQSEYEDISTKSCQCDCSCDETNQTESMPKTSDQSTSSDGNQRWLAMPEGLKKSLEALRQSFLGKTEDYASIWFNKAADNQTSTLSVDRDTSDNKTENTTNSRTREISSSLSQSKSSYSSDVLLPRRKKHVKINVPQVTNRCDYCDLSEACEEDDEGCYAKDSEVQNPERADRSQGAPTLVTEDESDMGRSTISIGRVSFGTDYDQNGTPDRTNGMLSTSNTRSSTNRDSLGEDNLNRTPVDGKRGILRVKLLKEESTQDSGGGSSCAGACDRYYRDKLMATLQILENKDETIRVQSSSLGVAEDRIADLTSRASSMRQELDTKARELTKLRKFADSSQVDKSDASIMAEIQDAETQKLIVETLEDNLSVIEELYRECFYETVKQEDLIDLLRKSYLDVRLMERDKSDKISRLQNVILTQKRSLEQCQDVVVEVESLKSEISSFLNSSNNDSGMWERGSEVPDVGEELGDILELLRQLQAMLTCDCTCGLNEENKMLKERNEALKVELNQVRQRNNELDAALRQLLDQQYEKQLKEKEREFQEVRQKLIDVENTCKQRGESCETLKRQLQQAQVMLDDKSGELQAARRARAAQEAAAGRLRRELDTADLKVQEGLRKLAEATQLRSEQVLESQATISELERQLQRTLQQCRQLEQSCREKERSRSELQASLEEAQARGAALCEESRRVTARVRGWMRRKRALLSEQQEKIKRQEAMLRELQSSAGARQSGSDRTSQSETEPCCSNSLREYQASDASYPRCSRLNKPMCRSETDGFSRCGPSLARRVQRENETASCSKCVSNRLESRERLSASEMASCSQAPVPPRRQNSPCDDVNCPWSSRPGRSPDVRWVRAGAGAGARGWARARARGGRGGSPADDVLRRVEQLHAALAAGQRRWGRNRR